jgi:hypothetical protein
MSDSNTGEEPVEESSKTGGAGGIVGSIGEALPWVAELEAAGLGAYEADVHTLVASAGRPSAAWAVIRTLLDPEASPHYPPATVGEAARSYLANEPVATGFRRRLFEGYLRGEKRGAAKQEARVRAANADAWRDKEAEATRAAEAEEREGEALVRGFRDTFPERYAAIERAVEQELAGFPEAFRAPMRKGAILSRVKAEAAHA